MVILKIEGLFKYFGGRVALQNCNIQFEAGKIYGIVGPNGAGKTTLFNCITGFLKPEKGSIRYKDQELTGFLPHQTCHVGISRTFQRAKPLSELTLAENVMVGAFKNLKKLPEAREKAERCLRFISLYKERDTLAVNLNTGGRKKLELARCLATDPEVLLLDEIVAGLNPQEIEEVVTLLKVINAEGKTLLVVEHVMDFITSISDEVIVLNKGEFIAQGPPRQVMGSPEVVEAYLGKEYVKGK